MICCVKASILLYSCWKVLSLKSGELKADLSCSDLVNEIVSMLRNDSEFCNLQTLRLVILVQIHCFVEVISDLLQLVLIHILSSSLI